MEEDTQLYLKPLIKEQSKTSSNTSLHSYTKKPQRTPPPFYDGTQGNYDGTLFSRLLQTIH